MTKFVAHSPFQFSAVGPVAGSESGLHLQQRFLYSGAVELRAADQLAPTLRATLLPILRRHCFECHGPKIQEADLRLDQRHAALEHPLRPSCPAMPKPANSIAA